MHVRPADAQLVHTVEGCRLNVSIASADTPTIRAILGAPPAPRVATRGAVGPVDAALKAPTTLTTLAAAALRILLGVILQELVNLPLPGVHGALIVARDGRIALTVRRELIVSELHA